MFRLSKAAEYAIRGIHYLSLKKEGEPSDVEEVAKAREVPPAYLAKLFQALARKGLIRSLRGPAGGFILAKKPREICFLEVIEAVEGPIFLNDCLLKGSLCPKKEWCPVHDVWTEAQRRFLGFLRATNFEDIAIATKSGNIRF